jgi:hypothetical protein
MQIIFAGREFKFVVPYQEPQRQNSPDLHKITLTECKLKYVRAPTFWRCPWWSVHVCICQKWSFPGIFSALFQIGTWNFPLGFSELSFTSSLCFIILATAIPELLALGFFFTIEHMHVAVFSSPELKAQGSFSNCLFTFSTSFPEPLDQF